MTFVECDRITGHKAAHDSTYRSWPSSQQQVKVVRNESPGIALGLGFFKDQSKAFQKSLTVFIVFEDLSSFNSPCHHMLQEAWGVKSGLARHGF